MSPITTHILDVARGRPAAGVRVTLALLDGNEWRALGRGEANADGRVTNLLPAESRLAAGTYRLGFETGAYFQRLGVPAFYPVVQVVFLLRDPDEHYHVPLLLSPYGYSTYRGS